MTETTDDALLDEADEAALRRIRAVAYVLDEAVRVPGTNYRVGVDPTLSLLPGAGSLVGAGLSLYIVAEAAYLGVPLSTVVRMLANVAVDTAVGAVPVVGVLFDAAWKSNKMNVQLVERALAAREASAPLKDPVTIEIEDGEE